ncbi:MAG: glycosyltransferase family 4 protein [Lutibacter sp.]|uniref:MraY family glycosyltransferase n=1 Tax=Lutibacter sp. TaxID=1925666 RepID=UPI00179EDAE6|nr:glycosyltransferase family 4 protein [Lutibacter sp.]MBT8318071.1 glycosyltransferase family 4 protein [Lutibacter sp.]NNJ58931.1 glycosyltransferase family 4 protein [Lutibacter sp.]
MEYIIISIFFVVAILMYNKLAETYNIVDNPNFRSSHTIPTIRGGGILFYIAVVLFFILSNFQYPYFFAGISSIALVSFIDDLKTLSAKVRLPFQFLAVSLVLYQVGVFNLPILVVGFIVIIGVGFINLYNFMDGINGITGLYSLAVLLGFLGINYFETIVPVNLIGYTLVAILVFGFYNFRGKARLFAGDIGSISLAVLILFLGVSFIIQLKAPILLLMVSVYGIDSGLTILYRIYLKENITQGHRHHIYQKLVDVYQWSHLKVAISYALVQLGVSSLVIVLYKTSLQTQYILIGSIAVTFTIGYVLLFLAIENKKKTLGY